MQEFEGLEYSPPRLAAPSSKVNKGMLCPKQFFDFSLILQNNFHVYILYCRVAVSFFVEPDRSDAQFALRKRNSRSISAVSVKYLRTATLWKMSRKVPKI
jgi:hypothetical protein